MRANSLLVGALILSGTLTSSAGIYNPVGTAELLLPKDPTFPVYTQPIQFTSAHHLTVTRNDTPFTGAVSDRWHFKNGWEGNSGAIHLVTEATGTLQWESGDGTAKYIGSTITGFATVPVGT
jgi:hypothetical protein